MLEHRGQITAKARKIAIVVSRFNENISVRLLEGAKETILQHGGDPKNIQIFWTPGSFEIPLVAMKLAGSKEFDGVLAIGCIVRGETPHFDFIAAETAKGLAKVMLDTGIPVGFGIITADTMDQAIDRAGGKQGNKGRDAALSLLEMIDLLANH